MKTMSNMQKVFLIGILALMCGSFTACSEDGWVEEGKHPEKRWPLSISNGTEKYDFDYYENTAIHYFDSLNAEKISFMKFRNPKKDVLQKRNIIKVEKYMVDGWTYLGDVYGDKDWPTTIFKKTERYKFDYESNTAIHYFNFDNAEKIWFNSFQDPLHDALEENNVLKKQTYMVKGWVYHNFNENTNLPSKITKGAESYVVDYKNNTAIHYIDNSNAEKIWFKSCQDVQSDIIRQEAITKRIKYLDNGWQFDEKYGENKYPAYICKGDERYEFDFSNGFTAYHFVNGRRTEGLVFNTLEELLNVRNDYSSAKVMEYIFDHQGVLDAVKYPSKNKEYYMTISIGSNGKEDISSIHGIYKTDSGFIDDKIVSVELDISIFNSLFGDYFTVYEIDTSTGDKVKVAYLSASELKSYLLTNYLGW